jgi:hypothetical protein
MELQLFKVGGRDVRMVLLDDDRAAQKRRTNSRKAGDHGRVTSGQVQHTKALPTQTRRVREVEGCTHTYQVCSFVVRSI